jgi:hypothetical protein
VIYSILRPFNYLLIIHTIYFVMSSRRNRSGREGAEDGVRAQQANPTPQSVQRAIHVEAVEGTNNCYSAFAEPSWCGKPHFELALAQRLDHHLSNRNTL